VAPINVIDILADEQFLILLLSIIIRSFCDTILYSIDTPLIKDVDMDRLRTR
jgi:hypothetical protein